MAIHQRSFLFIAIISVIILLAGCGGGSTAISFPPPQGGFNNSNLTGAFAFSYTGTDGGGFLAVAGSFVSDGAGHITSGMQDINSGLGIATNAAITGTYTVRADGRGSASLASPAGNTTVDFVLVAGGHALVTRFDANAAGSGTIDQQTAAAFSNTALAGTYAFSISGIDTINNPMSMVGNFTADNTGALTAGIEDSNDNGGLLTNDPVTGSIPVASTGRGTATFTTGRGTLSFAYYVVDATHLKLVETDSGTALSGDAFSQTGPFSNASVTGPFAFTIAGSDIAGGVPFAAGGVLTSDGAGNVTGGAEDFNDGGTITSNAALTGTYALASTGRGTLTITTSGGPANFIFSSFVGRTAGNGDRPALQYLRHGAAADRNFLCGHTLRDLRAEFHRSNCQRGAGFHCPIHGQWRQHSFRHHRPEQYRRHHFWPAAHGHIFRRDERAHYLHAEDPAGNAEHRGVYGECQPGAVH